MSAKPPKKSDLNKQWMRKRRDTKRMIRPEYHLIVSEGTETEPNYFGSLVARIDDKYKNRLHFEVHGEASSTVRLVEIAKSRAQNDPNGFKHVWVVFDKDDFAARDFDAAIDLCKKYTTPETTYHPVWSNECFELWFLLHFIYLEANVDRDSYHEKLNEHLTAIHAGRYEKNRKDMFDLLEPRMDLAIQNAKKLHKEKRYMQPSASAPCTTVYTLVETLKPYL